MFSISFEFVILLASHKLPFGHLGVATSLGDVVFETLDLLAEVLLVFALFELAVTEFHFYLTFVGEGVLFEHYLQVVIADAFSAGDAGNVQTE